MICAWLRERGVLSFPWWYMEILVVFQVFEQVRFLAGQSMTKILDRINLMLNLLYRFTDVHYEFVLEVFDSTGLK